VSSSLPVPLDQPVALGVRCTPTDAGLDVTLSIDGAIAGTGTTPPLPRAGFSLAGDGLSCGFDAGSPVGPYDAPFIFSGTLDHVVVDVSGAPQVDAVAQLERILRHQ
jgi:hypothetical protein